MPTYGLLNQTDIKTLESILRQALPPDRDLKVVEIGVHEGKTARGIHEFVTQTLKASLRYWGIDANKDGVTPKTPPFPGANLILEDSSLAFNKVNGAERPIHVLIVDGCHCHAHALSDFLLYGQFVAPGGFALFHDVNPKYQNNPDYKQPHGGNIGVCDAVRLLRLRHNGFEGWLFHQEAYEADNFGGFIVVRRDPHRPPS